MTNASASGRLRVQERGEGVALGRALAAASERTGPIAFGALIRFTMSRANSGAFKRTNEG